LEIEMTLRKASSFLAAVAAMACSSAHAGCELTLEPTTSGFFLNPRLEKVIVRKVSPSTPGEPCPIMANDELLQVNDQVIPGRGAKEVMAYWKALPKGSTPTFKIRRGGSVISVVGK
jgi:hypothetical protein